MRNPLARSVALLAGAALLAVAGLATAQTPRVGDINLYGLHKVTAARVLRAAKARAGDPIPPSKGDMVDAISEIPDVVQARVEAVCCEGPNVVLFLGIEERGAPHVAFRSDPAGDATLPEEVLGAWERFQSAGKATRESGIFPEQFTAFAEDHLEDLGQVLRTAAEPDQRAIAAALLGYAPPKQEVIDDLQYALQDPDESVRDHALQALRSRAVLAVKQPKLGLRISPTWMIELLNSVVLSDRLQAADLLLTLTDTGDRTVLDQIRARALPALVEMARWQTLRYALPPFLLVGRVAGLKEEEIQRRWSADQRESVIAAALRSRRR